MEKLATETATQDELTELHYEVLSMLTRPKGREAAFNQGQIAELKAGRISTDSYQLGYSYTNAVNYIRTRRAGAGPQGGLKALSLMIWDLLEDKTFGDRSELRAAAEELHRKTGGHVREIKVSNPMLGWIAENKDMLKGTVSFLSPKAELAILGASSKQKIRVHFNCCGKEDTVSCSSFTEKVKSHRKYGTVVKCKKCSQNTVPLSSFFNEHIQLLDDSGASFDHITQEQFSLPSGSTELIEVYLGCHGDYVTLSADSLRNKVLRAVKLGHTRIACNDCSVPQGKIEGQIIAFFEGNITTNDFLNLPAAHIQKQFRIPGIETMPFDMLVTAADGTQTIVEVDGGFHYENPDPVAFAQRLANDRLKTETALKAGYNLVRIDERKLMTLTASIHRLLLEITVGAVERYTVTGEECPGAASADIRLKGWA